MHSEQRSLNNGRIRTLQVALAAILLLLSARLFDLQVLRAGGDEGLAASQAEIPQRLPRGRIVDQRGVLLATDVFLWEVGANPLTFHGDDERLRAAVCLQEALGIPHGEILSLLQEDSGYVVIKRGLPTDIARRINGDLVDSPQNPAAPSPDSASPGDGGNVDASAPSLCTWPLVNQIWATPYRRRLYPQGEHFSHFIGFIIRDGDSYYGLEEYYQEFLEGRRGPEVARHTGGPPPQDISAFLPSDVGHDLVLTVDWRIQQVVEKALTEAVASSGAEGGTIIVMDPASGAILASASYPAYNPNRYEDYAQGADIFADPAISRIYEPGSVFKVVTLAIALDSGTITPDSIFNDPGILEVGGRVFRNASGRAYGQVSATEILARSLNVGIAHVGEQTGTETFYRYLPRFGFGAKTGVDLAHEADGLAKYPSSPNWSLSDFIANTFGQAISVTPLQMVSAVAAVANGGVLMQPHVVDQVVVSGEVFEVPPIVVGRAVSAETAHTLTRMMVTAVQSGAPDALIDECEVAGKTGTAQVPEPGGYHDEWTIASFVGFAPAERPAFACIIKIDKPQSSIWGAEVAAPVFREIAPDILRILQVPPDA